MSAEPSTSHVIVAKGSSGVRLTERELQIAELLSFGYSHKKIATYLDISPGGVSAHITRVGKRIEGDAHPSMKIACWFLEHHS